DKVSPLRASESAKVDCWKLCAGNTPSRLKTARLATVPIFRYLSVSELKLRCRRELAIALTLSGSNTRASRSPHTATALRFFDPITAPTPPRPACRPSLLILAKRRRFSPAALVVAAQIAGGSSPPLSTASRH